MLYYICIGPKYCICFRPNFVERQRKNVPKVSSLAERCRVGLISSAIDETKPQLLRFTPKFQRKFFHSSFSTISCTSALKSSNSRL